MDIKTKIELANLILATVSGLVIASIWNWVNHRLEQYRYLDQTYQEILKAYLDQPQFGRPEFTSSYAESFKDAELWKYHYFAMRVHTFLETIFDLSKIPLLRWWHVSSVWRQIYRHHKSLHGTWLRDHGDLHEPAYVTHVVGT